MQHRAGPCDDNKGVAEPLKEVDQYGNGIRVPATYYLQYSNMDSESSQQRLVQMKVDDPL